MILGVSFPCIVQNYGAHLGNKCWKKNLEKPIEEKKKYLVTSFGKKKFQNKISEQNLEKKTCNEVSLTNIIFVPC